MSDFKKYPYQDFNSYNLDWIIQKIKEAETILENLDANMQTIIVDKLTEWLDDGTLSNIFTTEVLSEISEATAKNVQQDAQISALESEVTGLYNRKRIICIGDSISQGYRPNQTSVTGWPVLLRQKLGLNTSDFFSSLRGGAGFVAASQGANFIQLLQALYNTITDKASITDIYVVGGVNDANINASSGEVSTAVNAFCEYANTNYPNATVHVGCIACYRSGNKAFQISNVHAGFSNGMSYKAVTIQNIMSAMLNYAEYCPDGIHVNQEIENAIANAIVSEKGRCGLINGTGTANTAIVDNACMPNALINGDTLHYWFYTRYVIVSDPTAVKGNGTLFKVCDMTAGAFFGLAYNDDIIQNLQAISWTGSAQSEASGNFVPCTGTFYPYNGSLYCAIFATEGNAFVGNITRFNVYATSGSLPII